MKAISLDKSFFIPFGVIMTGIFISDLPGEIAGNVIGDLYIKGKLTILEGSVITGNLQAEEVQIWGEVTGFVECSGKLILEKGCFIKGNIRTVDIQIEEGAIVDGIIYRPNETSNSEFAPKITEKPVQKVTNTDVTTTSVSDNIITENDARENQGSSSWF